MKISEYHLGFLGFGHMAQVIFKALDRAKLIPRSQVYFLRKDPHKMKQSEQEFGITSTSLENLVAKSDLLFLCVRPNQASPILKDLSRLKMDGKKLVTMLAGVKLAHYQKYLGNQVSYLRVMPNIGSAVGEGMTVLSYGPNPTVEFQSTMNLLFSSMGEVIEVPEHLMDISCGIAGSGPGFVIRLIDAVAKEGVKHGLSPEKALKMAAQTFAGASRLILKGGDPELLLQQIATPNGVTAAGLDQMSHQEIDTRLQSVIDAARKRSKELSNEGS